MADPSSENRATSPPSARVTEMDGWRSRPWPASAPTVSGVMVGPAVGGAGGLEAPAGSAISPEAMIAATRATPSHRAAAPRPGALIDPTVTPQLRVDGP